MPQRVVPARDNPITRRRRRGTVELIARDKSRETSWPTGESLPPSAPLLSRLNSLVVGWPTGVSAFRETDGGTEAARPVGSVAIVIVEAGLKKRRLNGKHGRVEGNACEASLPSLSLSFNLGLANQLVSLVHARLSLILHRSLACRAVAHL